MSFIDTQKLITNNESLYLKYQDVNNLYGSTMSQKLPVNKFEWIEDQRLIKIS